MVGGANPPQISLVYSLNLSFYCKPMVWCRESKLESFNWPSEHAHADVMSACVSCSAGGTEEGKECFWLVYSWTTESCLGQKHLTKPMPQKPCVWGRCAPCSLWPLFPNVSQCQCQFRNKVAIVSGTKVCGEKQQDWSSTGTGTSLVERGDIRILVVGTLETFRLGSYQEHSPWGAREAMCEWTSDSDLLHLNCTQALPFLCLSGSQKMTGVQTSRLCCWRLMENHHLCWAPRQGCLLLPSTPLHPPHYRPAGLGLGAITFGKILSKMQRH